MKASATNEGHIARLGLLPWRCHGDQEGSNYRPGCAAGGGEPRRPGPQLRQRRTKPGALGGAAAHIDITRNPLHGLIRTADAGGMPDGSFAAS